MTPTPRPPRILRKAKPPTRPARLVKALPLALPPPAQGKRRGLAKRLALALLALVFVPLIAFRVAAYWRETKSATDLAPLTGQFVETGHGRMFLQDAGPRDRTPIVLIHGTAAWSEFWRGTIDHLVARGHRVVALDLPPFGFSDRAGAGGYTRETQANRIVGALSALGIDKAILVGHSFGAGATVESVMRYPERVAGLVLVAAALGLPDDGMLPTAAPRALTTFLAAPVVPGLLVASTATNPLLTRQLLGTMIARKDAATPELAAILQRPMTRRDTTRDFVAWATAFVTPDLAALSMSPQAYSGVRTPAQIIWGTEDTLTPLAQGERLARLIPGAALTALPRVGHIPQIEDPAAFRTALDSALAKLPVASTR